MKVGSMQRNVFNDWLEQYFDEVTPVEFYRGIFPAGELEGKGEYVQGKYCGIAVEVTKAKKLNGKPKINRYSITDDLEVVEQLARSNNFCLCSPISYAGKERTAEHARFLYAIAVDLDRVRIVDGKPAGLISLWNGHVLNAERLPKPTYIVSSGTGLHVYYVLDEAIPLFQNTAKQLQALKRDLTRKIWGYGIVNIDNERDIQQEGIYQGFRMPGTVTKLGDRVRAFETGGKVSLAYLNEFVDEGSRVTRYAVKKDLTLSKAKELYPEWYERRIEQKQPPGVWHVSRNLYDWWKREILEKATVGHRYWCLMTLSVYAYKCSMYDPKHNPNPVTREELEKDCFDIMEHFETLTTDPTNHFDEADVQNALEAFESRWIKYPRDIIEYRCGFQLPHNRRNGRKQAEHIKLMNFVRDELNGNKDWRKGNGRKSKRLDVIKWQTLNPNGTKADCIRATGMDRKTVSKYWIDTQAPKTNDS